MPFRRDNDPLRRPELGHSGQYLDIAVSIAAAIEESRAISREEMRGNVSCAVKEKTWMDIKARNTAARNESRLSSARLSSWKLSSLYSAQNAGAG